MLIDLHVLSNISRQGKLDAEDILIRAREIGLDGVCFVEDRPIGSLSELENLGEQYGIRVFVGRKVLTEFGYLLFYPREPEQVSSGEFFPYNEELETPLNYREVLDVATALNGALIAAHPYMRGAPFPMRDRIFSLVGLDGIEVRNGSCDEIFNDFALEASFHLKLPGTGGSGLIGNLSALGTAATLFRRPVKDQTELVEEIKEGQVWPVTFIDPNSNVIRQAIQSYSSPVQSLQGHHSTGRRIGRPSHHSHNSSGGGSRRSSRRPRNQRR